MMLCYPLHPVILAEFCVFGHFLPEHGVQMDLF